MPTALETQALAAKFFVLAGEKCKELSLPEAWSVTTAKDAKALCESLEGLESAHTPAIIILDSDVYTETITYLRGNLGKERLSSLLFLVVADDAEKFLTENQETPEHFDVVSKEFFTKNPKFFLLKTLRDLTRSNKRQSKRINQEMLERLNHIFIALSAERDQKRLLGTILTEAVDLTGAETGTLYMVSEREGELFLNMRITQAGVGEVFVEPIHERASENNTCGYVILTGKPLNITNHDGLKSTLPLQFQKPKSPSEKKEARSVLAMPLKNSENEIIAVLELINKKSSAQSSSTTLDAFDPEDESLMASFIAQAAICLENTQLYTDIQGVFDGFVKASITAIEARDPSTGGHSERVANMTVALAKSINDINDGVYRSVKFKVEEVQELEYAALLHDVGKIGVREEVLVKAKKLYPSQLEAIKERIKIAKEALRINYLERQAKSSSAQNEYMAKIKEVDEYWRVLTQANEPSVLKKEAEKALEKILHFSVKLSDGYEIRLLNEEEYSALSVPMGSLTESERLEVESHVRHTYQFLKMIPWTKNFRRLPEIAYAHHEKLNGTGYPRSLLSHEIPLQSKIMTVADIFDALTAADRWYKEAIPTQHALDILQHEVNEGKLDPILFDIFVQKKIFNLNHPKLRNQKTG